MTRFWAGLAAVAVAGLFAGADDKKDKDQPVKGRWTREAEGATLTFHFKTADQMVLAAEIGDATLTLTCKYTADKAGKVKATVTKVEQKGDFPAKIPEGYEMKFTFKADKDKATLTDYEAENADRARHLVEGEYKPRKSDE